MARWEGEQEHLEKGGEVGAEVEDEETGSGGGEARGAGDAKGDAIAYVRTHRILFAWHLRMRGGGVTSGHLADSLGLHLAYVGPTATAYSVRMATTWCATSGTWLGGNANAPLVGVPHTYRDVRNIKKMRIVPSCLRTYVRTYVSASGPYRWGPRASWQGVRVLAGHLLAHPNDVWCGSWL